MSESINARLAQQPRPAFMNSRAGWAEMFELRRPREPHLHQIEPSNACPYRCVMCPRATAMRRPVGFMPMDLFTKVIDEVAGYSPATLAKEVELFHFGESLLHPHIVAMSELASSAGLNTVLSVNAPELTPARTEALLRSGLRKLIISLDGYDQASYAAIRGPHADYAAAVANLHAAAALQARIAAPTTIVVRMIVMHANRDQAEDFRSHWQALGLQVELRPFFPWGEPAMAALGEVERFPPFMPCPFPWQYLVVQWNGDVVACCRDHSAVNVMGNVADQSLLEIWNGPRYAQFRQRMASGAYDNPICPPCMALYYHEDDDAPQA